VPPKLVRLWVKEFLYQTAQGHFWKQRTMWYWLLTLRTSIAVFAERFPEVQKASGILNHWTDSKSSPIGNKPSCYSGILIIMPLIPASASRRPSATSATATRPRVAGRSSARPGSSPTPAARLPYPATQHPGKPAGSRRMAAQVSERRPLTAG
jgi:hypothetical protein